MESFNQKSMEEIGIHHDFVQDTHSHSARNILRGLHYQIRHPQGRLVHVVAGAVFAVAVDLRVSSSTFGKWVGVELSGENHRMFWLPPGIAHGSLVTSSSADFICKTTEYYSPESERAILWNDSDLGIKWPLTRRPFVSEKDAAGTAFREAEVFA